MGDIRSSEKSFLLAGKSYYLSYYSLRRDIYTVLRYRSVFNSPSKRLHHLSYIMELCILSLILLNVVLAIADAKVLVKSNDSSILSNWYQIFLFVSTTIFTFDYFLRVWSCVEDKRYQHALFGRFKWMVKPMSLIDLASLLPFYMELCANYMQIEVQPTYRGMTSLRGLRLLRVFSFLRLERYYNAMQNLRVIFSRKSEELYIITYLTTVVVLLSSTVIFFLESEAQPNVFTTVGRCAWWSIETITSLGYGDIVPVTSLGRTFASVLALWGMVLFALPGAIIGTGFIELMLEKNQGSVGSQSSFSKPPDDTNNCSKSSLRKDRTPSKQVALLQGLEQLISGQVKLQESMNYQREQLDCISKQLALVSCRSYTK